MTGSQITGVIDLHAHSSYSDGALRPRELLERAKASGVELSVSRIMIRLSALSEAEGYAAGKLASMFIPGIEISSTTDVTSFTSWDIFSITEKSSPSQLEKSEKRQGLIGRDGSSLNLNRIKIPLSSNLSLKDPDSKFDRPAAYCQYDGRGRLCRNLWRSL